ncbi:hypothetical protein QBC34DRAFT_382624 [Podospora aff. communis PSN243]|uniref:Heterokaryon incompatibility domain-containing protein n=1 Tax=Podospora aff. communis PSN243 TaxID=3040156 RepID=A0AAV9GF59_9PEZI|nr:hypothetical protein QBC34DRAFT_382624 [Podospora aff. communis PSN243]
MSDIFSKAERVVAWLGEEQTGDAAAMKLLEQVCSQQSLTPPVPTRLSSSMRSLLAREKEKARDNYATELNGLSQILKRPWFGRAWIAQELVLSSKTTLMSGKQLEMEWDTLFEALLLCEKDQSNRRDQVREVLRHAAPAFALGITRRSMKQHGRYSLLELLELFSHTEATIEVDKIFALLGLAHDGKDPAFSPDYDSPLEDVVRSYANGFIDRGQILDLLYRSGDQRSYPFSSWVPHFTSRSFPKTISIWESNEGPFAAGGVGMPVHGVQTSPGMSLHIKGYTVTAIHETLAESMTGSAMPNFFRTMAQFRDLLNRIYYVPDAKTLETLLVQVPIGKARSPHLEVHEDRMKGYDVETLGNTGRRSMLWPPKFSQLTAKVFASRFGRRQGDVKFCVTENRLVGLVPPGAEDGDVICVIPGDRVPFAIRRLQDSDRWKLIGECYIEGIMYGQGSKGSDEMPFVIE